MGPHKTIQVGMVRGLFSRWKQPIYYAFDTPLSASIILEVIEKLYNAGYVVALTTDLGPTNTGIQKELHVGIDSDRSCFFVHPQNTSLKIFVFADAPHLLKLLRNNFIDREFIIDNKLITKECLERLLAVNVNDLKIAHRLEEKHLDVKGPERQKVSFAAKVFSNTTAEAIRFCGMNGYLDKQYDKCENYQECADLLKLGNDWFDVLNSNRMYGRTKELHSYGIDLQYQNSILDKITSLMKNMRVANHHSLLPFQKGIVLTNISLQQLYNYLVEKYTEHFEISFIMTRRLNQDVLENFFSYIRAMGAGHDKPSALQFKYRLRWYILGKHSKDMLIEKCNTEDDEDPSLINAEDTQQTFNSTINQVMTDIMGSMYDEEMEICMEESMNDCVNDDADQLDKSKHYYNSTK